MKPASSAPISGSISGSTPSSTPGSIIPIPAFDDNYIWLIQGADTACVIDPGDAAPVLAYLQARQLALSAILITHHHHDHIGGVETLIHACEGKSRLADSPHDPVVYAPARGQYRFPHIPVSEGQQIDLRSLDLQLEVLEVPGHTLDHVAYYGAQTLFCGDTLCGAGCGRLFEGTAANLYNALLRFKVLPAETRVYCTHEYTLNNLRFAQKVEPQNPDIAHRIRMEAQKRQQGLPTLPSTLALESATNPFLRCHRPEVMHSPILGVESCQDALTAFTQLRLLRDGF